MYRQHIAFIFISLLLGALHDILERCCGIGCQWFIQSREKCDAYPTPIGNIASASDQMSVSSVIRVRDFHIPQI